MAIRTIVQHPASILRHSTYPVVFFGPRLHRLLDDMVETMQNASGVGLAAPQVGVQKRVLVAYDPDDAEGRVHELINPEILEATGEQTEPLEGCLSIPDLLGNVVRFHYLRVKGKNRNGGDIQLEAEGFLARVLQHEMDHLDGILFIDRAKEVFPRSQYENRDEGQSVDDVSGSSRTFPSSGGTL
ncbi:peptide deformylase [Pasteuria penetrans]|uniref:peptide deformylase n=1 Tax=Pasteuria penetrans TaxID=86005 RepID=UPI000FBD16E9|nr:peptide deformylase [Pasteuria penetrans]